MRIENAACKIAVEGRSLYHARDPQLGDLQLVVVADFAPGHDETRATVAQMFQEYHVRLFEDESLPALEADIRTHGKPQLLV